MKILIIGGGGREHAIAWKLAQSTRVSKLYCAPGNAGIAELAECVDIGVMEFDKLIEFAKCNAIDITVAAPDDPLVAGIVDRFNESGLKIFGPDKAAAIIEGSKSFSKSMMKRYGIPTAKFEVFNNSDDAIAYIKERNEYPIVIKADGLALGKGVIIAEDESAAVNAIRSIIDEGQFGDSGNTIVIEEFLTGTEVSVLAFTDGKTIKPMVCARDHKRSHDGDKGLNTGGMGTFSPSGIYDDAVNAECMEKIFIPTMDAMNEMGRSFKGVLYFGLIKTRDGMKVIEYNCRFGDPEAQVVLPRLKTDLLDIIEAVIDERLGEINIEWDTSAAVCVIMASGGYPLEYKKGLTISGLDKAHEAGAEIFHAGTSRKDGQLVTSGGRVLGVTCIGRDMAEARDRAYSAVKLINFEGAHYRTDIGK